MNRFLKWLITSDGIIAAFAVAMIEYGFGTHIAVGVMGAILFNDILRSI